MISQLELTICGKVNTFSQLGVCYKSFIIRHLENNNYLCLARSTNMKNRKKPLKSNESKFPQQHLSTTSENKYRLSRRDFIAGTAAVATLTLSSKYAFTAVSDTFRVGLIGCGGRGIGAAKDCVNSSNGVEIVAIGDLFEDRMDSAFNDLKKNLGNKAKVTKDTCFVGFDAYEKVIACDVNLIILATPPHFRPAQLKAAIEAGKHVFM